VVWCPGCHHGRPVGSFEFIARHHSKANHRFPSPGHRHLKDLLKGQCHEIFNLCFFHQATSPRPLIAYGLEFAKIVDFEIADFGLSGVNETAEAKNEPWITSIFLYDCFSYRIDIDTAEMTHHSGWVISAVSLTPRRLRVPWARGNTMIWLW
jgi:hypothetical protein